MKYKDDLHWIKDALGLSMDDLALALNLSCAELYHWLDNMSPPDPRQENLPKLRKWVEKNVAPQHRKTLKLYWHQPIRDNITLIEQLHKLACGESLGKIKVNPHLKVLTGSIKGRIRRASSRQN